jgi:UDP-N-acetylmuramoyl-tripeptide--D-alanyl-D-alanine ligase
MWFKLRFQRGREVVVFGAFDMAEEQIRNFFCHSGRSDIFAMMDNFIEFLYAKFLLSDGVSVEPKPNFMVFVLQVGEEGESQVTQALQAGASYVVVENPKDFSSESVISTQIPVVEALRKLTVFHRNRYKRSMMVISGGYNQEKALEDFESVLAPYSIVHASAPEAGEIEAMLAVLSIYPQVEIAIVCLKADTLGDITSRCEWLKPQYGIVTAFEDKQMSEAQSLRAYSELLDYLLKNNGVPILNQNDLKQQNMIRRFSDSILFTSSEKHEFKAAAEAFAKTLGLVK